ncbi:MAG: flippase-like domain-containing protein [Gemmatimonadota bacterium]|nr:flippase-like domain-containing protein [Gemmatimonadota bacterium]
MTPTSTTPPRPAPRRRIWLRLAGSAIVLAILLIAVPLDALGAALSRVSPGVWAVLVIVYLGIHQIGVAKWRMLMRVTGANLGHWYVTRCYLAGLFGNTFLPSVVGGDVIRTGLAIRKSNSAGTVLLASVVDRFVDVLGLGTVAGLGILLIPAALDEQSRHVFLVFCGLIAVVAATGAGVLLLVPARRVPWKVRRRLVGVRSSVRALTRAPGTVGLAWVLAVTLQSLLVVMTARLGHVMGIDVPLSVWMFAWPLAKISALVPLTQGGIGIREAALVGLLAPFGVPAASALAVGLAFQGIILTGGVVGGLIAFAPGASRVGWSTLRAVAGGLTPPKATEHRT